MGIALHLHYVIALLHLGSYVAEDQALLAKYNSD